MADRVAELMEERLKVRGAGLPEKLRRGGRLLPRKVRVQAQYLAEACRQAEHPHLRVRVDMARVAGAYDATVRHLTGINRWQRRRVAALDFLASAAFNLLVLAALVIAVLIWRGYL
ncbi:MAG: hypothetical protein H5U19_07955 [Rhodobacteraceae bacterium]|nr:hypothetical protein [Paracoccaceae bacterium]